MSSLLLCCIMFFVEGSAFAVKPGETVNPNGFPEGFHFNLNIHGKKLEFNCPDPFASSGPTDCPLHDDEFGTCVDDIWKYSGSLFIPEANATKEIKILIESGKSTGGKGNKNKALNENVLEVIDPCTADFDGDAAVIQLPPCDGGYDVYARALAKPTGTSSPSLTINDACLNFAEDGDGRLLFFLGTFGNGWFHNTFDGTFTRIKGKNTAVDITKLFEFTGNVCYHDPACVNTGFPQFCTTDLCCTDTGSPDIDEPDNLDLFQYGIFDGTFDVCVERLAGVCPTWEYDAANKVCFLDLNNDDINDACEPKVPSVDGSLCPALQVVQGETLNCTFYPNTWIFDIPDFAQYFWDIDNKGLKLLQLRFYPRCDGLGQ